MSASLHQIIAIFIGIAAGFVCRKAGVMTEEGTGTLLLVIGSVLASVPIRQIFTEWRSIPYVVLRLFGIAALVAFLLSSLNIDPVLKGVLILMAAMPAATNSTMLCTIYGGNRELSAKLIFLSTALSIITIPLWSALYFA